ncbi:MAG: hypothetical protein JO317_08255, partial [Verrucomicrobiae bacterium]|nr:hypothetical protein [Verrucomicrobiae bacterium]
DRVARELPWARFAVAGRPPLSWPGVAVEPPEKLLSQAAVAVVASGTATLEAALSGLPQLVIYKVSPFTFWLGRQLVKIPHLAMPNVLTREEIVPEFLQERCSADLLAPALIDLLSTPERQEKMRSDYLRMRALLGQKNAAAEAARQIWQGVVRGSACVG